MSLVPQARLPGGAGAGLVLDFLGLAWSYSALAVGETSGMLAEADLVLGARASYDSSMMRGAMTEAQWPLTWRAGRRRKSGEFGVLHLHNSYDQIRVRR